VPPTASRAALIFSASALATFALISWGSDSTSFLACQRQWGQKRELWAATTKPALQRP
jgi:hypothetical protein